MQMFSTTGETHPVACRLGVQNQLILLLTAVPEWRQSVNSPQNFKNLGVRMKTATRIDSCWAVLAKQTNKKNQTKNHHITPPQTNREEEGGKAATFCSFQLRRGAGILKQATFQCLL